MPASRGRGRPPRRARSRKVHQPTASRPRSSAPSRLSQPPRTLHRQPPRAKSSVPDSVQPRPRSPPPPARSTQAWRAARRRGPPGRGEASPRSERTPGATSARRPVVGSEPDDGLAARRLCAPGGDVFGGGRGSGPGPCLKSTSLCGLGRRTGALPSRSPAVRCPFTAVPSTTSLRDEVRRHEENGRGSEADEAGPIFAPSHIRLGRYESRRRRTRGFPRSTA